MSEKAGLVSQLRAMEKRDIELIEGRRASEAIVVKDMQRAAEEGNQAVLLAETELRDLKLRSSDEVRVPPSLIGTSNSTQRD